MNLDNIDWNDIDWNDIDWNIFVDTINNPIHYLAYHNRTDIIKSIDPILFKKLVTIPNLELDNIAHIAARMHNVELLKYAIKTNLNIIYQYNKLVCTPLSYVVHDSKLIMEIIEMKDFFPNKNISDHYLNDSFTLMEYYIFSKEIDMVKYLLNNIVNDSEIIFAIILSENTLQTKLKMLKLCINHELDINVMDSNFLSPLIVSVYKEEYEITKMLLEEGANPNYFGSEDSSNPLTIAIINDDESMVKLLLKYDIETNIPDKNLRTPVHHLFYIGNNSSIGIKIKKRLLEKSNINSADNRMNTILNLLVHNDDWKLYEDILERKKLKIYIENMDGIGAFDMHNNVDDFLFLVYKSYHNQLMKDVQWVDPIDAKLSHILRTTKTTIDSKIILQTILQKIKAGHSYPQTKNKSYMLKILNPPKTNITHYSPYTRNYICYLYYILKKYPSIKIPELPEKQLQTFYTNDKKIYSIVREYSSYSPILLNHIIIWKNEKNYFIPPNIIHSIYHTLLNCKNITFIIIKLIIVTDKKFNHANILICDIKRKCIERFDPYGNIWYIYGHQLDKTLGNFFESNFSGVTYLPPVMMNSFQIFSDETNPVGTVENDPVGFCTAWCLWYVEMRIKNIDIDPRSLVRRTITQINRMASRFVNFKDYIRNYSDYLDSEKNKLLHSAKIPEKYWYCIRIPERIHKLYLEHMRKLFGSIIACNFSYPK